MPCLSCKWAEIAARAGLTKRTFFRYFADKREVLFSGSATFQENVVAAVIGAPEGVAPIDAVVAALAAGGTALTDLGEGARQRQRLIDTSTDLQEREMIKMAGLTKARRIAKDRSNSLPLTTKHSMNCERPFAPTTPTPRQARRTFGRSDSPGTGQSSS